MDDSRMTRLASKYWLAFFVWFLYVGLNGAALTSELGDTIWAM